ncbi:hypothetical protein OY671_011689, partial [Metschnikowia pulcherrima]
RAGAAPRSRAARSSDTPSGDETPAAPITRPMPAVLPMRINLRGSVLALTIFSAIAATANASYASYRSQREQLITTTSEANRVYAAKSAQSAGGFLKAAERQSGYSARQIAAHMNAPDMSAAEVRRVQEQSDT